MYEILLYRKKKEGEWQRELRQREKNNSLEMRFPKLLEKKAGVNV